MELELRKTKKGVISALSIALAVVLPLLFHAIPDAGSIYSPMHIPVLLCGLITGPWYGLFTGLMSPIFSSIITGMPPAAYLPPMIVECAIYGLIAGLLITLFKTGKTGVDIYIALVLSMLIGRCAAGVFKALIFARGSFTLELFLSSYFIVGSPGIILHLIAVPALYLMLEKARIIPVRY